MDKTLASMNFDLVAIFMSKVYSVLISNHQSRLSVITQKVTIIFIFHPLKKPLKARLHW